MKSFYSSAADRLAFHLKKLWFQDILKHAEARKYLWSLYFAGEAYEELHPEGVFIDHLVPDSTLQKQLTRHLKDETRHAQIFKSLLKDENAEPLSLEPHEDIAWYVFTQTVPDVLAKAKLSPVFDRKTTLRYMAFLHVLERRSIGDLQALQQAASSLAKVKIAQAIQSILKDEQFHASYTRQAVLDLAIEPNEVRTVFEEVRRGEQRHLQFCFLRVLQRFETLGTHRQGLLTRLRWKMLKQFAKRGWAVPLLDI